MVILVHILTGIGSRYSKYQNIVVIWVLIVDLVLFKTSH